MKDPIDLVKLNGNSMSPVLLPGDELLVEFNKDINPSAGDILFTRQNNQFVAHRMVSLKGIIYLKGDRSTVAEPLAETQIWGRILGYQRANRKIYWGSQGQPFKKYFAWLSAKNQLNLDIGYIDRWRRWICLIMMIALNQCEKVWLKAAKAKPYGNSIF